MARNEVTNLFENRELETGWRCFGIHTRRVAVNKGSIQPIFLPAVGWLWLKYTKTTLCYSFSAPVGRPV